MQDFETELTRKPKFKIHVETLPTSYIHRWSGLKVKDVNDSWRKVREIKRGYKYTTFVDDAGDTILRVENGAQVETQRKTMTKASIKAEERRRQNVKVMEQIEAARTAVQRALDEIQEEVNKGHMLQSYYIDNLMIQNAASGLWLWVADVLENESTETKDPVAAYKIVRKGIKQRMLGRYEHRSLSRSTSVTSNLMEDVDMDQRAQFIDFLNRY